MAKALSDLRMTVADFVRWPGDGTDQRHELVDGRPVAMAPQSGRHAEIASNIFIALYRRLAPPCRPLFGAGVALSMDDHECREPDVFVTCEPTPEHIFLNARVVVEVLSPSTEKDDRTVKLDFYQTLPAVEAVLLVWQDKRRVQLYVRDNSGWPGLDYTGLGVVPLVGLGIELPLDEVYAGVEFPPPPPPPRKRRTARRG